MPLFRKLLSFLGLARYLDEEPETDPYDEHTHEGLREEILQLALEIEKLSKNQTYRILFCSGIDVGKSSLINNIISALDGKLVQVARHGDHIVNVTQKYLEYKMTIRKGTTQHATKFVLCDTCGSDEDCNGLIDAVMGTYSSGEDMKGKSNDDSNETDSNKTHANEGHSTSSAPSEENESDKRSAVAILFVISAHQLTKSTSHNLPMLKTILPIYTFANTHGIPVAFFITRCDIRDHAVEMNINFLYKSKIVQEARHQLHNGCQGFPLNRIFPIVNYTHHMRVTPGMMIQTLYAMKHVMSDIHDYLSKGTYRA